MAANPNEFTTETFLRAMARVPERKLKLVEMVNQLVGTDGRIDYERVQAQQASVNLARAEAIAYCRSTEQAFKVLTNIRPRAAAER